MSMAEPGDTLPEQPTRQTTSRGNEADCQSCGRFIGSATRCPYCGARATVRLPLSLFRWGSVAVALLGLPLLYVAAVASEPRPVEVAGITPTMNFALVELSGEVVGDTRIYRSGQRPTGLVFSLDDGSGQITVRAFRGVASVLVAQDTIPRRGDRVSAIGSVRVRGDDDLSLLLQDASHLRLEAKEPTHANIADVLAGSEEDQVLLEATVAQVYPPALSSRAPWRFTLAEGDDRISLIAWPRELDPNLPLPWGRDARLRGRFSIDTHRGKPQLSLMSTDDIELLAAGEPVTLDMRSSIATDRKAPPSRARPQQKTPRPAEAQRATAPAERHTSAVDTSSQKSKVRAPARSEQPLPIASLDTSMLGRTVVVAANVVRITPFTKGLRLHLNDAHTTGEIQLILWQEQADQIQPFASGTKLRLQATVRQYKDSLQLQLSSPSELVLLERVPATAWPSRQAAASTPHTTPLGRISHSDDGRWLTTSGTLGRSKAFSKGVRWQLEDGTESIELLLWNNLDIPSDSLQPGTRLQVRGQIKLYRGVLQIVPARASDISAAQ